MLEYRQGTPAKLGKTTRWFSLKFDAVAAYKTKLLSNISLNRRTDVKFWSDYYTVDLHESFKEDEEREDSVALEDVLLGPDGLVAAAKRDVSMPATP